jgi:hypothetical protein
VPHRAPDQPPHQVALEPQLDRVHRLVPDLRERGDDRRLLQHHPGAQQQRAVPVDRDQPAVPLLAGHDRGDGVLPDAAGELVVPGDQQDAVGRGQVGVGEHLGRGDHALVGPVAQQPAGRREVGERVVGRGVQQPQPLPDLLDVLAGPGAGGDVPVGPQAQHRGTLQERGHLPGDLGQPTAGQRDVDELVVHPVGEAERLGLLVDDRAEHLGDDLVQARGGRQRQHREPPAVGLGEHLGGQGVGGPVGQRGVAAAVQPLDQRPALHRVGGRQRTGQHDQHVGTGAGQRVGAVVDGHVPDDPPPAGDAAADLGARHAGQGQHLVHGEAHAVLEHGPVGLRHLREDRLHRRRYRTERCRPVALRSDAHIRLTLGHCTSPYVAPNETDPAGSCQTSLDATIHPWRQSPYRTARRAT